LAELIDNSIQALESKPADQQREIKVHLYFAENKLQKISVWDNGSGMNADVLSKW